MTVLCWKAIEFKYLGLTEFNMIRSSADTKLVTNMKYKLQKNKHITVKPQARLQ